MKHLISLISIFVLLFVGSVAFAKAKNNSIVCDDSDPQTVRIVPGRVTVLSFPLPPEKVLPGSSAFDFEQIKKDLAIKALRPGGHTNVVIYLAERRCVFELWAVSARGDDVLTVRDPKEDLVDLEKSSK